jgi:hypothetical protein
MKLLCLGSVVHYLDAQTRRPLIAIVEKQLLQEHVAFSNEKANMAQPPQNIFPHYNPCI